MAVQEQPRGLGANIGSDDWKEANSKKQAQLEFDKQLRRYNQYTKLRVPHRNSQAEQSSKEQNIHDKVRNYSQGVHKPKSKVVPVLNIRKEKKESTPEKDL